MDQRAIIRLTRGVPADESYPIEDLMVAARAALASLGARAMQYGPALGFEPLREWLAAWRGVALENVLTANGSLQIIDLLCHRLLEPDAVVFTESPSYDRALTLFRRHRARVVGIPLEADGPDLDALESALKRAVPRFFYVIPDFQNPSGATSSLAKRRALVSLARQHGFRLLEDGPYRPLRYEGEELPSLFDLGPDVTLHMLSLSKLIGPGARVGILYGPPDLLREVARVAEDTYISPGFLAHAIAYEYCHRGLLPAQIERLKALYGPRREACLEALARELPEAQATRPEGGFFVSMTLPAPMATAEVRERARAHGLELADGQAFFPDGGGERFVRLPYCALAPAEIEEGVRRLSAAVREAAREQELSYSSEA